MFIEMAGKRAASTDLNHDNWDDEEKPEEAGTFKKASDDVLEKRIVKKAKRRLQNSEVNNSDISLFFTIFFLTICVYVCVYISPTIFFRIVPEMYLVRLQVLKQKLQLVLHPLAF